jgi:hypothetical protein
MTERERLAELISECIAIRDCSLADDDRPFCEGLADYLLAHGVIAMPCKVGDVVYQTDGCRIYESTVREIIYDTDGIAFDETAIGKSVFLTREEAEAELAERR